MSKTKNTVNDQVTQDQVAQDHTIENTIEDPINDLLAVAPFVEIEGIPVTFSRGFFRVHGHAIAFYKDQEVILVQDDKYRPVQDLVHGRLGVALRKWIESHSIQELISLGIVDRSDRDKAIDAQKHLLKAREELKEYKRSIAAPKPELTLEQRLAKEKEAMNKKIAKRANARALIDSVFSS